MRSRRNLISKVIPAITFPKIRCSFIFIFQTCLGSGVHIKGRESRSLGTQYSVKIFALSKYLINHFLFLKEGKENCLIIGLYSVTFLIWTPEYTGVS